MVQWVGQEPSWVCCQQPRGGIIIRAGGFSTPSCPLRIWIQIYLNRAIYCTRVILGHLTSWGCLVHTLIANCSLRRQPLRWEWQEKKTLPFSIIHSLVHFPLALLVHSGLWGFRSLSPLSPGERWAYTLDMSSLYCRATQKEKQPFTPKLKDKLEFALRLMIMFLGCARKPENLKRSHAQHGEKIPAPHRPGIQTPSFLLWESTFIIKSVIIKIDLQVKLQTSRKLTKWKKQSENVCFFF